jgi:hypothetical protein
MKKNLMTILSACMAVFIMVGACQQATEKETIESEWLGVSLQEMAENIESQFGGFDQTMIETAYRYKELHWAGVDENWDYARYQLEEMEETLERGFVRRPERKASAKHFLETAIPNLFKAIDGGSKEAFMQEFMVLTASCNTCHAMEEVPFMMVKIPESSTSLIKK